MEALVAPPFYSEVYIGLGVVCAVRWFQVIPRARREQQWPGPHSQDALWCQKPWGGLFGFTRPGLCCAPGTSIWRELPTPKALCGVLSTTQKDRAEICFACKKKIGINIRIFAVSMSSINVQIHFSVLNVQFCVFSVQFCTILPSIICKGDLSFR